MKKSLLLIVSLLPAAGCGGSAGSMLRFNGSATGPARDFAATDSHWRKMAPAGGFYEAAFPARGAARSGAPQMRIAPSEAFVTVPGLQRTTPR